MIGDNKKKNFYDRLKYGTYIFESTSAAVPASRHANPDGTVGGWIADSALVEPTCYIAPGAKVYEYAVVEGDAQILGEAFVHEFGRVSDNAIIDDFAEVCGSAHVKEHAYIGGSSIVAGDSIIGGRRKIEDDRIIDDVR